MEVSHLFTALFCRTTLCPQVLKWSKNLPGTRLTFQREWMLGRRLNAAARQDPTLNLLLQTGIAISDRLLQLQSAWMAVVSVYPMYLRLLVGMGLGRTAGG